MNKSILTISRKWHNPQINTVINTEGIELSIPLDDFIQAVIQELGPVTWMFKDATFQSKLNSSINNVLQGIKEESAKVV
jgi:hypothetical protein